MGQAARRWSAPAARSRSSARSSANSAWTPDGRLRPRRRRDPFAEREIRAPLVPQRRALLGAHPRRAQPVNARARRRLRRGDRARRAAAAGQAAEAAGGGLLEPARRQGRFRRARRGRVMREIAEEIGVEIELTRSLGFVEMIGIDDQHWVSPIYLARDRRRASRSIASRASTRRSSGPLSTRRRRRWRSPRARRSRSSRRIKTEQAPGFTRPRPGASPRPDCGRRSWRCTSPRRRARLAPPCRRRTARPRRRNWR